MILKKEHWTKNDFDEFEKFQNELNGSKRDQEWEQRIVNTKLHCLGKTSGKAREIVKTLKRGSYLEFLENIKVKTHFESLVCAFLINEIKDFDEFEKQLDKFVETIDNWASCDTLKFAKKDKEKCKTLSYKYLKSEKPYVRRVGVNIWFDLIKEENYISQAFDVLDSLSNEAEYYVNMSAAWLLSDCMARNRELTIKYFENNKTNSFVINKAISKCRDSFRVSSEDKDFLLKFKRKDSKMV